jgi:hypothetical protein
MQQSLSNRNVRVSAIPLNGNVIKNLPISNILRDGGTQCRVVLDKNSIDKYRDLMEMGVDFPPVSVWFDSKNYWLSDGFQRIAAAEQLARTHIVAEIRLGRREDAQWDSYGCNATHGLPRTGADIKAAVVRAFAHPNSTNLSNGEIARHLGIPESTFRRWRKEISPPNGEDGIRIVNRNGQHYTMRTEPIGRNSARTNKPKSKSLRDLSEELNWMKATASDDVRYLLNVVANWAFGPASAGDSLKALELIGQRWKRNEHF